MTRYSAIPVLPLLLLAILPAAAQQPTALDDIVLPDGFEISVYAEDVPDARSLALGDDGTVYVSTRRAGNVYAIVDSGGARRVVTVAEDLNMPNGVAFRDGDLYVAEMTRILRFPGIDARLAQGFDYEVVADGFPDERHHGWRYIAFGPDGMLYMAIGAPCNVCDREGFGTIIRLNPDGTGRETVAYGVRNSVGLAWHPETGELWFTDNGRDMLGDDLPPGELNRAPRPGLHFGFPYCHGGEVADPEFGGQRDCSEFRPPAQKLGPHVAPLGLVFYDGDMFPPEYRGRVLIAEHGSWNRSQKIGYRITMVPVENGEGAGYEVFARGWLQGEKVSGRPVDLLVMPDGSLLVSDDHAGKVYRITYTLPMVAPSRRR